MKLYKTYVSPPSFDTPHLTAMPAPRWAGSQAEAASQRKQLNQNGFKRDTIVTDEVEVPTNKKGLLAFLNGADAT